MTLPDISRLSLQPHEAARTDARRAPNTCNPDKPGLGVCVRIRPHPGMLAVLSEPLFRWFRTNAGATGLVILGPRPPREFVNLHPKHRWFYNETPEQTLHQSAEWGTLVDYLQSSFRDPDIQIILGYQGEEGWVDLPDMTWEKLYEAKLLTYSKGKYIDLCMRPYWGIEHEQHTRQFLKALRAYNLAHSPVRAQKLKAQEAAAAAAAAAEAAAAAVAAEAAAAAAKAKAAAKDAAAEAERAALANEGAEAAAAEAERAELAEYGELLQEMMQDNDLPPLPNEEWFRENGLI